MLPKKSLTTEQALQKLKQYCGYQERCHADVRSKLFSLGVNRRFHDEIVSSLIEEKYLDEERFAIAFARGHFRLKKWGRIKIRYELKKKQVSEYSINKSLKELNEKEYRQTLEELAHEKYVSLKNEQWLIRKKKTIDFLLQRGFESALIQQIDFSNNAEE